MAYEAQMMSQYLLDIQVDWHRVLYTYPAEVYREVSWGRSTMAVLMWSFEPLRRCDRDMSKPVMRSLKRQTDCVGWNQMIIHMAKVHRYRIG